MLDLVDVTLRIAGRPLLEGASLHVAAGQRLALVGRNGSGKTSLLRLIEGELQADQGEVRLVLGASIGTVAQEAPGGCLSPLESVLAADRERARLLDVAASARDPLRIAEAETRLAEIGAHAAPARAARILKGLGFADADQHRPLSTFSGGWRMRVALAATLFLAPDLLLLDEPTNHLDLEAAMWLEEHLRTYPRTLILVSHDRDLLNAVPERIVHLEGLTLTSYTGGYDAFERLRRQRFEHAAKLRQKREAQRKHVQAFIDRFRYKASKAKQAQSRIKFLERLEPVPEALAPPEIRFEFETGPVPPPPLITLEGAEVGYEGRPVLRRLDLRIDPDDRIALLGANGNGKSTFARLLVGRLEPLRGSVTRARGLRSGFFAQHQIEDLEPGASALEHLQRRLPEERDERLRARLARFGLIQEKAETQARHLSGGEKTRLCFALMCAQSPQILILDEPTNHLDIDSREALIEAINDFEGAVILISHDRRLIELCADQLWLVKDGHVRPYDEDIDAYRRSLLEPPDEQRQASRPESSDGRLSAAERRSRLAPLRARARDAERKVENLMAEKERLALRLADPATYTNGTDVKALEQRSRSLGAEIAKAEALWLEAEAEIEALG